MTTSPIHAAAPGRRRPTHEDLTSAVISTTRLSGRRRAGPSSLLLGGFLSAARGLDCTHKSAKSDSHSETGSLCSTGRYERHVLVVRPSLEAPFRPDEEPGGCIHVEGSEHGIDQAHHGGWHQRRGDLPPRITPKAIWHVVKAAAKRADIKNLVLIADRGELPHSWTQARFPVPIPQTSQKPTSGSE